LGFTGADQALTEKRSTNALVFEEPEVYAFNTPPYLDSIGGR
jgi:hypothetical protein